jgi:hypothetical protein
MSSEIAPTVPAIPPTIRGTPHPKKHRAMTASSPYLIVYLYLRRNYYLDALNSVPILSFSIPTSSAKDSFLSFELNYLRFFLILFRPTTPIIISNTISASQNYQ